MNQNPATELQLAPDFATRVLEAADRRQRKQRHLRWFAGASILCVGVGVTAFWRTFDDTRPTAPGTIMLTTQASPPRGESADPLTYLFPDAEPLARFAAEDNGNDSSDAGALFDDQNQAGDSREF